MKKIYIAIITLLALAAAVSGCFDSKKPVIHFDGMKYNFGEVTEGEDVVFTFMFFNKGNKELLVTDLYVSCFCVVVRGYDKTVAPGGRGKVFGVVQTKGFSGPVTKLIQLKTNISKEEYVLTLEGIINPM